MGAAKSWDLRRCARPNLKRRRDQMMVGSAVAELTVNPSAEVTVEPGVSRPADIYVQPAAPAVNVAATAPTVNITASKGDKGDTGPSWKRNCAIVTTGADGLLTVNFPAGRFTEAPVCNFQPVRMSSGDTREYSVTILTYDKDSVSVRVRRSRTLPAVIALLSTLVGFDTWEAPGAPVTLHMLAEAAG